MNAPAERTRNVPAIDVSDRQALGRVFGEQRQALGMTQRQLESRSKVPQGKISRIERGVAHPTVVELSKLADALELRMTVTVLEKSDH